MYHSEKLEMPEHFRAEFSQLMSVNMSNTGQDIYNRCVKCDMGNYPLSFPIYRQM